MIRTGCSHYTSIHIQTLSVLSLHHIFTQESEEGEKRTGTAEVSCWLENGFLHLPPVEMYLIRNLWWNPPTRLKNRSYFRTLNHFSALVIPAIKPVILSPYRKNLKLYCENRPLFFFHSTCFGERVQLLFKLTDYYYFFLLTWQNRLSAGLLLLTETLLARWLIKSSRSFSAGCVAAVKGGSASCSDVSH